MSTFFMFWLYAAPAARMSSLQKLRFVGIATHDSIGIGEDGESTRLPRDDTRKLSSVYIYNLVGPTHQPIALGSFYRSMPNFNLLRPADAEETMGAWIDALEREDTPSLLTLSRQAVPMLEGTDRTQVPKGAYIVYGKDITKPDLTIISTGAEVYRAIEVAKNLQKKGIQVKIASMPSMRYFDAQSAEYKQSILPTKTSPVIAIEAWGSFGWARYAHASLSMHTFGYSAPSETLYDKFGFSVDNMTSRIDGWLSQKKEQGLPGVGEFEELLLGHASGH
jgi:dihydroxyacetone synthase